MKSTREILYRGKRIDNGEWVEGLPGYNAYGYITGIEVFKGFARCYAIEVEPETICQYTGLTDKNGRKIYEGDIVKHDMTDTVGTVKWYQEDYIGWCVDDARIEEQQFTYEMWGECEIIGNIFDNLELIDSGGESE